MYAICMTNENPKKSYVIPISEKSMLLNCDFEGYSSYLVTAQRLLLIN